MKRPVVIAAGVTALVVSIVLAWIDIGRERTYQRLLTQGTAALAAREYARAVEAFSGAITLRQESMLAHLRRGETYLQQRQYDDARRDLATAARLDPTAPQPLTLLGDVAMATGAHAEALEHYRRVLALDDRDASAMYKTALAVFETGQPEAALDPLGRALALDDRLVEAHHLLGVIARTRGRQGDAIAALTTAVSLDPTFAPAREELARVYEASGRRRESLEQMEALAALDERSPERLVSLAMAYARSGRHDAAVLALDRAAARGPAAASVRTALGRIWLELAEPGPDVVAVRKAVDSLRPVVESGKASSEAGTLYGRGLLLLGRIADAERVLQQAAALLPVDPLAFRYLSMAARRLGHRDLARDADRKYSALVPPTDR